MKIVYNRFLPWFGKKAINLFGVLFVKIGAIMRPQDINHEEIHTRQIIELGGVFFYLIYFLEWLIRLPFGDAYHNISFEREAYANQYNMDYLENRKWFAWVHYIFNK